MSALWRARATAVRRPWCPFPVFPGSPDGRVGQVPVRGCRPCGAALCRGCKKHDKRPSENGVQRNAGTSGCKYAVFRWFWQRSVSQYVARVRGAWRPCAAVFRLPNPTFRGAKGGVWQRERWGLAARMMPFRAAKGALSHCIPCFPARRKVPGAVPMACTAPGRRGKEVLKKHPLSLQTVPCNRRCTYRE